jgi:hypothetical protein
MLYKKIPWISKYIQLKVIDESKNYIFLPMINYKGYIDMEGKHKELEANKIIMSKLINAHKFYIDMLRIQDTQDNMGIYREAKTEGYLAQSIYLDIMKDKNKVTNLFNKELDVKDSSYIAKTYIQKNIIEENYNDIESRKMSNRLLLPHYFFTGRYNQKSLLSQTRSWTSSVYNFLKVDKSNIKHIDLSTGKLIKLFFSVKHIKTKKLLSNKLKELYKIVPNEDMSYYMNRLIKYTSRRSSWSLRKLSHYPSVILTIDWLKNQIEYASILNKYVRQRKGFLFGSYKSKEQIRYRNTKRTWLSNPLFKHTPYNLIIDLFIFNNKGLQNEDIKFINMLSRRALYKYMYSMYVDYINKVKETLNRPRFFYINLIEPKTYNYYSNIVKAYEELIIINKKKIFISLLLLILRWKNIGKNNVQYINYKNKFNKFRDHILHKNNSIMDNNEISMDIDSTSFNLEKNKEDNNKVYDIITNINEMYDKKNVIFKRRYFYNYNSFSDKEVIQLEKKYKRVNNKKKIDIKRFDILKRIFIQKKYEMDLNKNKKKIMWRKPKYLKYKKYLDNLEVKSNAPNNIKLWRRKYIGTDMIQSDDKKKSKLYLLNKYSLEDYKRKIYYAKGKRKRKIAPKLWKVKLMSFNLLSQKQKKEIKYNRNYIDYKSEENEIYKYVQQYKGDENNKNHKIIKDNKNKKKDKLNLNQNKESLLYDNNKNQGKMSIHNKNKSHLNVGIVNKNYKGYEDTGYIFNETMRGKIEYIKKLNQSKGDINNILNPLFKKFYVLNYKKYTYISYNLKKNTLLSGLDKNLIINEKKNNDMWSKIKEIINKKPKLIHSNRYDYNDILNVKRRNHYSLISCVNNLGNKSISSKTLWDNLDHSIIWVISKKGFKKYNSEIKQWQESTYNSVYNTIKKAVIYSDMLYLELVKKEFFNVNRDVVLSKVKYDIPIDINSWMKDYKYSFKKLIIKYNSDINGDKNNSKYSFYINLWPSYDDYSNISNNGRNKKEFNDNIFKPYYRNMVSLFIYESYKSFISYIWYNNMINNKKLMEFISNINWVKGNKLIIFNFIVVRTLLDLLQYNYRSLIRVKPKYYYLNTVRYYGAKLRRLHLNTWIASVKYIKRLRKTPRHFWMRYNRLASYFYKRLIQSAELDTKRKVFIPFVIYLEDLLYIIYGKWAIVRLWPIRRYYLNSYILAERIMFTLVLRRKKWNAIREYRKEAKKLISILKWFQIKKAYDYINEKNVKWPIQLMKIMNNKSQHYLNYRNLERYNEKLEKNEIVSVLPIRNSLLKSNWSLVNKQYFNVFSNYIIINALKMKPGRKHVVLSNKGKIDLESYVRLWLGPLNNYIKNLKTGTDIKGLKFRLAGRTGMSASNSRSYQKYYLFGNLIGSQHNNKRTRKITSLSNPMLRNTIKSNIDYANSVGINRNGCLSLKVWLSSLFTSDVHELLLHLLRIKYLHSQLVNRYYMVPYQLANLKYNLEVNMNKDKEYFYLQKWEKKKESTNNKYIYNKLRISKKR